MAERVGPAGRVLGVDVDAALGGGAARPLHRDGHAQCDVRRARRRRRTADTGGAVRPGVRAAPALPPAAAGRRPAPAVGGRAPGRPPAGAGLRHAGRRCAARRCRARGRGDGLLDRRHDGRRLRRPASGRACPSCSPRPASANPTAPTSPAAWSPLAGAPPMLEATFRSVLPAALARGVVDARPRPEAALAALHREVAAGRPSPGRPAAPDGRVEAQADRSAGLPEVAMWPRRRAADAARPRSTSGASVRTSTSPAPAGS